MNTLPPNHPPNAPDPLAVALAKLDPSPHGFDWNALMFAAGRASKSRALAFWRAAAVVGALAACGFAFALFTRPPVVVERVVVVGHAPNAVAAVPVVTPPEFPGVPAPTPAPQVAPAAPVLPESPAAAPLEWSYEPPAEPGAAARWLSMRNEVLTVGLTVLPDRGRTASPPREK